MSDPILASASADVQFSWNLLITIEQLLAFQFMRNALLTGTLIAITAGAIGYFMVLRGQSFAGHTLANVGFAGAAGATLVNLSPVVGMLLFAVGAAIGIEQLNGRPDRSRGQQDVAISTIQTFALGLGLFFVHLSTSYATGIYALLFGAVLGISDRDVWIVGITAIMSLLGLLVIARPLLFASVDPAVAEARGVPVRWLDRGFLLLLAVAVAQAVQVVGVLLIFSLLVTPPAIAERLTARPAIAVLLSIVLALSFTLMGLTVAYFMPYPVGFFVTSFAFGTYVLVRLLQISYGWIRRQVLQGRATI